MVEKHVKPVFDIECIKKSPGCYVETFLPPLTKLEEQECLCKLRASDEAAKEKLILHNMRLVAHVVKKYSGSEEDSKELISIGTIGLIKAVDTFKNEFGNRFATYAIRCIENEILMYFRGKKKTKCDVSLYEPIGTDKEGNQIQLLDVIENQETDIEEMVETQRQIALIRANMDRLLDERERYIISKRYCIGGADEMTQKEIAKKLGISRSYVSRIEKKALEKLKKFLS